MKKFIIVGSNNSLKSEVCTVCKTFVAEIKCAGIFDDIGEALEVILEEEIALIFLDTQNKDLEVASFLLDIANLNLSRPYIIGCSSLKEDAYLAFQYNLSDFLLINSNKLSIQKCFHKYFNSFSNVLYQMICIKSNRDYQYIPLQDILFLKADNNTTDFL